MMKGFARQAVRALAIGVMASVVCGCGGGNRSHTDIVPATDKARAALETALTAWKNGAKCGKIEGGAQPIEVVDRVWKSGAKLSAFEIVKADDKPGPRWFTVRLTLANASGPQEVPYAVLGLDPLWVFREEDFQKLSGM